MIMSDYLKMRLLKFEKMENMVLYLVKIKKYCLVYTIM